MPAVAEHYEKLLAGVYSWMLGGFDQALARNVAFLERLDARPRGSGVAVDLGAGCGFQAIPLARAGFRVTAIDLDRNLLAELERHRGDLPITTVADDLLRFEEHVDEPLELAVCVTDTLLHLESADDVRRLLDRLAAALIPGGRFIATFRDLSLPLDGLDRFIPLRNDDTRILTCFLEYESLTVKVHDLLYRKTDAGWQLTKSWYRKLRLSAAWVRQALRDAGFAAVDVSVENGLTTVDARR